MRHCALPAAIVLSLVLAGCAKRQAQVAVQTALTGLSQATSTADEALSEAITAASTDAIERARSEGAGFDRYTALMAPWQQAVEALRAVRDALLMAQGAVTAWIATGELPASFRGFCDGIGASVEALLGFLMDLHVDVPDIVMTLGAQTTTICRLAGPWIAGTVAGE